MDNNNFLYTLPPFIPAGEFAQISNLGNILFVSANAPTSANLQTRIEALGRIDRPFQSINAAHLVSSVGDLIYCLPGTYNITTISITSTRSNTFYFFYCNITTGAGIGTFSMAINIQRLNLYLQNTTITFQTTSFFRSSSQSTCIINGDQNSAINSSTLTTGTLLGGNNPIGAIKNINITVANITGVSQRVNSFENCTIFCNTYPFNNNGLILNNCNFGEFAGTTANRGNNFVFECTNSSFTANGDLGMIFSRIIIKNSTLNLNNTNFILTIETGSSPESYFIQNSIIYCSNFLNRNNPSGTSDFLRVLNTSICNTGNVIENPTSSTLGRFIFISCNFKNNFTPFELTNPANIIVNPVVSSFISSP